MTPEEKADRKQAKEDAQLFMKSYPDLSYEAFFGKQPKCKKMTRKERSAAERIAK